MYVIALTGGIASGKSEAARFFGSRGAIVLDLDTMAKDLLEPGTDGYEAVVAAFGEGILGDDGLIVNRRLAEEAFQCDATAETLSSIVHPRVVADLERRLQDLALQAQPPHVVVIEIPMLVEAPALRTMADLVLTIEAPQEARFARSLERGMDAVDVRARMARQASSEERVAIADVVVTNDADIAAFRQRLDALWDELVVSRTSNTQG